MDGRRDKRDGKMGKNYLDKQMTESGGVLKSPT